MKDYWRHVPTLFGKEALFEKAAFHMTDDIELCRMILSVVIGWRKWYDSSTVNIVLRIRHEYTGTTTGIFG